MELSPDPARPHVWPQVILFGDSHFQRAFSADATIASQLADALQRRCDLLVRGFSGYNSRLGKLALGRFAGDLDGNKTAAVVVLFGSNDACEEVEAGQGVTLTDYARNLEEIISCLHERCIPPPKIVLVSPPPADQTAWERSCTATGRPVTVRNNSTLEKYGMACAMVAEKCGTKFVDLYGTMVSSPGWRSCFSDGLHLNATGSRVFYNLLWPVLDPLLENCGPILPDWKDVDPLAPEKSF